MKTLLILIKSSLVIFLVLLFHQSCVVGVVPTQGGLQKKSTFRSGLDALLDNDCMQLRGKRVGLITNQTGVNNEMMQNIDLFIKSENVDLRAIFSPEHGLFGTVSAGKKIINHKDTLHGVPIFSLYGHTRKPLKDMLKDLDILVFDIQDIGIRSYTYISTMGLAMEAALEKGIEFMVLDRPNPIGLKKIEGNVLETQFSSFIGMYPIPYVYGLTSGELAMMINGQGWLGKGKCDLTVVEMKNYGRVSTLDELGFVWVPTSPHVPSSITPIYMVATGILGELGIFSIGVGYTTPFMTIAAPWIDASEMADRMNMLGLKGVMFRPINYKPYYSFHKSHDVGGVQIHIIDQDEIDLIAIQFYFLQEHNVLYPDKNPFEQEETKHLKMFDKALGTDVIRKNFSKNFKVSDIQKNLMNGLDDYKNIKSKYHLYD